MLDLFNREIVGYSFSSKMTTETTLNPVTGCTKISPGCKNCYAERMAYRLQAMGQARYRNGFRVTLHEHVTRVVEDSGLFRVVPRSQLVAQLERR
ncbi:MAG: DUF5131 family protein, partial [Geobacteraceae bacterium]|nr:DUF5131 family protein [Geobacteraceae bacterium]